MYVTHEHRNMRMFPRLNSLYQGTSSDVRVRGDSLRASASGVPFPLIFVTIACRLRKAELTATS